MIYQNDFVFMNEIKKEKCNKWIELQNARYKAHIQEIINITDQEVMDRLGKSELVVIEDDQFFLTHAEYPNNFYSFTGIELTPYQFCKDPFCFLFKHKL